MFINYFFVTFCILIIINGSNFIDGMNTLCIGYYLLITSIIYYLKLSDLISIENISILYLFIVLLFALMALPLGNFETWEQPFDPEYFIYSCAN